MLNSVVRDCESLADYAPEAQVELIREMLLAGIHPVVFMAMVLMLLEGAVVAKKLRQ